MVQDFVVTQYILKNEVFGVANASPEDKWLLVSANNVIIKRSDKNNGSGEMTIVANTSVTVHFTYLDTGNLTMLGSTYKLFREVDGAWVEEFTGDITVNAGAPPAGEAAPPVFWSNGDNEREITGDDALSGNDDKIVFEVPEGVEWDIEIGDPDLMRGKEYNFKNEGPGTAHIKLLNATEVLQLNGVTSWTPLVATVKGWI